MLRHLFVFFLCVSASLSWANTHHAAIASAHPLATQAGFDILNRGGNAFDAAVAVTAALAVVEPAGSGLGGGGFWLLHREHDQMQLMIDGREMAPGAAHRDMYLNQTGEFETNTALNGPLAAGIPGVPAAMVHLSQKYGHLPLSISLQPAIEYAENGFAVSEGYQYLAQFRHSILSQFTSSAEIFLKDGEVPELGSLIKQKDLAHTLKQLADKGQQGFYAGDVANKLVSSVKQHGGIWSLNDLASYQIKERAPVQGHYQGYDITSAALPSSGGIVLMLALNQLAQFDLTQADDTQKHHLIIESLRRAYRERSRYLGDSDFVTVPAFLTNPAYAKQLSQDIDQYHASASQAVEHRNPQGENTTHFSIIDDQGNRVAATLSINYPFGSGFVAEGTGVLLNDEMDDFSAKVGAANVYGLVGNEANAIAPYKRPLSSMSPTFVENDDAIFITGTPGGSRIISMVLLSVLDFIEGRTAQHIAAAPRFHHQYLPDEVQVENQGFEDTQLEALIERGHRIKMLNRQYGDMQLITVNKQTKQVQAASDPRGEGLAISQPITR
ncbi:gamma-glutamyltransferase [Methylophaga thiooxydans]|uniref:Glutathione hydrolase proenzyme n=1 Tax=Methylophaga thiooxydans DMS010 TaxID=637616 RepID=C0N3W4_9GAMM|nr:gamma-glutamyltransferase [Methylophaga thiooxydans]EEF80542.1 gamma-glutamyltransferase [Methylophaga thiooxydans DMS010]